MTIDRPRRGTPAAMAVLGVLALGLGGWVVLNSAFFGIRDVRIEGVRNVATEEIRELAEVRPGENLVMLPVDDIARRVEKHPWILDARVDRDLPTTAVITVIERRPGGWLRDPGGIAIVAADGTVLERLQAHPTNLPDIGKLASTASVGERVGTSEEILRVAGSMSETLRQQIASLELQGEDVVGELRAGGTILYGPAEELRDKHRALAEMLRWSRLQSVEIGTIDVRVPSVPTLEPLRTRHDPSSDPSS